ncbi:MAG: hypothetical protein RLZZ511_407 [Cyanobacteriota bacterium]|jgi:phosphoribosylglycinamide formyltransferase-1
MRLGIMASGAGSNFAAIAQAIVEQRLQAQIQQVIYNNPGAGVVARADQFQIPHHLLDHRQFPSREALDGAIVTRFKAAQVDWVVMAGWMRIVTPVLLEAFPDRVLNIHPSLLPSFRGNRAVEQALQAGVKLTGCTVHRVVPEVDAGEILIQAAVPVHPDDTVETLQHRIHQQEHIIYPQAIALCGQNPP